MMDLVSHHLRAGDVPAQPLLALLVQLTAALEAVRAEAAGLRPRGAGAGPMPAARNAEALARANLSKRQRQVLAGIVRGLPNKVIAWELGLSVRTVEAYRAQLFERLGARNTADAVRLAIAAGFDGDAAASALAAACA